MKPHIDSNPKSPNPLLSEAEVLAMLGITRRTLRTWRKLRGFPYIRISNKSLRYRRADIENWLEDRGVAHPVIAA
jgi:predicted DNA-binding transcriptional regulator AlpA